MDRKSIIESVEAFVKENVRDYDKGHDWYHIQRVRYLAHVIGKEENAGNDYVIELAALLHDTGDSKFRKHDDRDAGEVITELLDRLGVEKGIIEEVVKVNRYISFSSREKYTEKSEIFKIVQDADRLDAIGAIGIARAFNYGGFRNNAIYLPEESTEGRSKSTIGHFHDKLLKLNGMMNTSSGRRIGGKRHKILERFLKQFYDEWNIKK
jgi:uncharacterized protein